jgi:hypothetical protein
LTNVKKKFARSYFWLVYFLFLFFLRQARLPPWGLFYTVKIPGPRSGDCEGSGIRTQDCCVTVWCHPQELTLELQHLWFLKSIQSYGDKHLFLTYPYSVSICEKCYVATQIAYNANEQRNVASTQVLTHLHYSTWISATLLVCLLP